MPGGLRTRKTNDISSSLSQKEEDSCLNSKIGRLSKFSLPYLFCSIQAFSGLDEAHPHWTEQSALLSLPSQMLISSRNNLTGPLKNNVYQISGYLMAPSSWHIKLTIAVVKSNLISSIGLLRSHFPKWSFHILSLLFKIPNPFSSPYSQCITSLH